MTKLRLRLRNGMDSPISKVIIIGLSITLITAVGAYAFNIIENTASYDNLELYLTLEKADDSSYISGKIDNKGTELVSDLVLTLNVDYDPSTTDIDPYNVTLSTTDIEPGKSIRIPLEVLEDINGDVIVLTMGDTVAVELIGDTNSGDAYANDFLSVKRAS